MLPKIVAFEVFAAVSQQASARLCKDRFREELTLGGHADSPYPTRLVNRSGFGRYKPVTFLQLSHIALGIAPYPVRHRLGFAPPAHPH